MANINLKAREIEVKIVYYGPGRGGKTTNLEYIFKTFRKQVTGEMVSTKTEGDRTLFFDFLPMGLGKVKGYDIRVQLYTVPGQVKYAATRKLVLKDTDGIIFVADSLQARRIKNMESLKDLHLNLKEYGVNILKIPLVIQYNKRDLAEEGIPLMTTNQMEADLNRQLRAPSFSASALMGDGVGPTLKACLKLTLQSLKTQMGW